MAFVFIIWCAIRRHCVVCMDYRYIYIYIFSLICGCMWSGFWIYIELEVVVWFVELMDQKMDENPSFGESSSLDNRMTSVKTKEYINAVELDSVDGKTSVETSSYSRDDEGDLGSQVDGLGSSDALVEGPAASTRLGVSERTGQIDQSSSENLSSLVDMVVAETVIVVNSDQTASVSGESREVEMRSNELGTSKPYVEKKKVSKRGKEYCVIDMNHGAGDGKGFKESWDGERVCRICQLSSEQVSETTSDTSVGTITVELIQLGCGCKDELGIAHSNCAEAWFKLKGNRSCEICGQTAKNITGVGDNRLMSEWYEQTIINGNPSERHRGCWRGQPFCNFLMACLKPNCALAQIKTIRR